MTAGIKYSVWFFLVIAGCREIPSDPNKTFEKAQGTGLAVGFSVNPPWITMENGIVGGIEAELIKSFAESVSMRIVWHKGSEQELLKKMEEGELHIVISGLTKDTPWKKRKIGLTMPYYRNKKEKHVIAVQQGENKLLMNLEKYLFNKKDSINTILNAVKQEF